MNQEIPLTEAARRLAMDYQKVRALLIKGKIRGGRDEFGRYYVEAPEIDRLLRKPAA